MKTSLRFPSSALCVAVAALCIVHSALCIAAAVSPAAADPVDLKPLVLESYGLRGAVALGSNTVVAVIGASATDNRAKASAWRIMSEEDPAYPYAEFVRPTAAKDLPPDEEFPLPPNFGAPGPGKNRLKRHLVVLTLPKPLKPGVRYGLVVGLDASTTGGRLGCFFEWDGKESAAEPETVRVPADDLAPRIAGLRRASPLGDGKIAVEFGASFSSSSWRSTDQWDVRVNGEPAEILGFGRRSKIDVYIPAGWPYNTLLEHDVYLDIGRELKSGDRVTVAVGPKICAGAREGSFVFDPAKTISRAIQANQIGYLPDGPKFAYLGFWLASFPEAPRTPSGNAAASASSDSDFEYSTPPTAAEVYFIAPPEEEVPSSQVPGSQVPSDEPANLGTCEPANGEGNGLPTDYDSLAPYALRFREPPPFELVREKDGKVVFRGATKLTHNGLDPDGSANHSAENVYTLDFTEFAEPGRYYLRVPGVGRSIAFDVAADVYLRPFRVQSAGVFAQRCGFELTPDHAPGWRRIACHTNGVVLTTVENWRKLSGMGPLRDNPVRVPNPAYPAFVEAQAKVLADPALVASFPLDGALTNAVAGSGVALAPLADEKPGGRFVEDEAGGGTVFLTGRKNNGLGGTFAVDPATGATAVFRMRRTDPDGDHYFGDVLRLGPARLNAAWGFLVFDDRWKRVGDGKWRQLAVRVHPTGEDGKTSADFFVNDERVLSTQFKPSKNPFPTNLVFGRVEEKGAAGCHFRDLRLFSRALADEEIAALGADVPPTIPKTVPLRGGHHDAGDYNPRCHIDVAQTLLFAWELAPRKFADGQLDIPEAGNGLPDIVDEALWSLRPWLSLQEEDGGVRDGTESQGDPGFAQTVELDPTGDFAYAKSSRASFVFAGAFAQASRVLASFGRKKEAADYLARARRAYDWGVANVPDGLRSLGQYAEYRMTSRAYAAAELLHTTGDKAYLDDFRACSPWGVYPDAPARADRGGRYEALDAAYAFLRDPKNEKRDPALWASVRAAVIREADFYIEGSDQMAYKFVRHPFAPITWGTGAYGNFLRPVLVAWFLTGDAKYRDWTIRTCDNMLGANPLGLSWIVGLGERCNRAPFHNSRYRPEGVVVDGMHGEGPNAGGNGYNYTATVYPAWKEGFATLHNFVDATFALAMNEGMVSHQALDMAVLGLLLPDAK